MSDPRPDEAAQGSASVRKSFKSQSLNSLFRKADSPTPTSPPSALSPKLALVGDKVALNRSSPKQTQATLTAKPKPQVTSLETSTGAFKLAAMKRETRTGSSEPSSSGNSPRAEPSTVWKSSTEPPAAVPLFAAKPIFPSSSPKTSPRPTMATPVSRPAADHSHAAPTANTAASGTHQRNSSEHSQIPSQLSKEVSTKDVSEEELQKKGIVMAHRMSTSEGSKPEFNWGDDDDGEDDEWRREFESMAKRAHASAASKSAARHQAPPISGVVIKKSGSIDASAGQSSSAGSASAAKAIAAAPWAVQASGSSHVIPIADQIKELEQKKERDHQVRHQRHATPHYNYRISDNPSFSNDARMGGGGGGGGGRFSDDARHGWDEPIRSRLDHSPDDGRHRFQSRFGDAGPEDGGRWGHRPGPGPEGGDRYRYNDYEHRYRPDLPPTRQELFNVKNGQLEPVSSRGPPVPDDARRGRRMSSDRPGLPVSSPNALRRSVERSPFDEIVPRSDARRVSSASSHGTSVPALTRAPLPSASPVRAPVPVAVEATKAEQEAAMREARERARKRKEEELQKEKEREQIAKKRADEIAQRMEERDREEQQRKEEEAKKKKLAREAKEKEAKEAREKASKEAQENAARDGEAKVNERPTREPERRRSRQMSLSGDGHLLKTVASIIEDDNDDKKLVSKPRESRRASKTWATNPSSETSASGTKEWSSSQAQPSDVWAPVPGANRFSRGLYKGTTTHTLDSERTTLFDSAALKKKGAWNTDSAVAAAESDSWRASASAPVPRTRATRIASQQQPIGTPSSGEPLSPVGKSPTSPFAAHDTTPNGSTRGTSRFFPSALPDSADSPSRSPESTGESLFRTGQRSLPDRKGKHSDEHDKFNGYSERGTKVTEEHGSLFGRSPRVVLPAAGQGHEQHSPGYRQPSLDSIQAVQSSIVEKLGARAMSGKSANLPVPRSPVTSRIPPEEEVEVPQLARDRRAKKAETVRSAVVEAPKLPEYDGLDVVVLSQESESESDDVSEPQVKVNPGNGEPVSSEELGEVSFHVEIPRTEFSTTSYYMDSTGYVHRREFETDEMAVAVSTLIQLPGFEKLSVPKHSRAPHYHQANFGGHFASRAWNRSGPPRRSVW